VELFRAVMRPGIEIRDRSRNAIDSPRFSGVVPRPASPD
jgi:hypothetical protein